MRWIALIVFLSLLFTALPAEAALISQVNQAYRAVYGSNPTQAEWSYWADRVQRGEKKTYAALAGAMGYQKAQGGSAPRSAPASSASAVSGFQASKKFYPSSKNPNFLPEGTLVKSPSSPNVYFLRDGKKSWVLPSILNRWFNENHFFKSNIVLTISEADLVRYPQAPSVNKLYIGKVLKHPNGTQFYIDDKLRKRQLPASVRSALKFPGGNLYAASAAHLSEFRTGPVITDTKSYPGGMVIYDGSFHGGRIWKLKEGAGGKIFKHLYLKDRFYEADGYPDEGQRAGVDAATLARHPRGSNVDRYPDGWVIKSGSNVYVMHNGARRLITSPAVLNAIGYTSIHLRGEYPSLYAKYAQGEPISAFKGVNSSGSASKGAPVAAPNTASNLTKVRPTIRTLIGQVNNLYRLAYDKDPTISENKFWVDYLYNGEVTTKEDVLSAMRNAKKSGNKPARTSRTATISEEKLEQHWFSYLFYFVHQAEPSENAKSYWYSRIRPGDRDSIEKLGGTLQWLKDTQGLRHK